MNRKTDQAKRLNVTRREFVKAGAVAGAGAYLASGITPRRAYADPIEGGSLVPGDVDKYVLPLIKPPAMPSSGTQYNIAVREFKQQILSPPHPETTVWSYGSVDHPGTVAEGGTFNYPAFTIEANWRRTLYVNWINDLVDSAGNFLPHLLPVDQTLHWANPPGPDTDTRGFDPTPYLGPVPIVTHVHGAHTHQESDGYPEAWFLPDAANIPPGTFTTGTYYDIYKASSPYGNRWAPGSALFAYPNNQRATTLWYHDHTLGMTRLNVYAGPAGFYLIRGGPDDIVRNKRGRRAKLPGPAPGVGADPLGTFYEIPIVIQDRSFNADGSLFYPDNRAFFEGLDPSQLQIPFIPDDACDGPSDIAPIWNPEFFGNMMVVNGFTWPYLEVEPQLYRFRLLNGCNSRFLLLMLDDPDVQVWQIGADGGYLPAPVNINTAGGGVLLMGPAERADVIVDFRNAAVGDTFHLLNVGPDEPFGGGTPGVDIDLADPDSTGQVMQFRVVPRADGSPGSGAFTEPSELRLPSIPAIDSGAPTRQVGLFEESSISVKVVEDESGNIVLACDDPSAEFFGPKAALLGDSAGPLLWSDGVTEAPVSGTTETWEIANTTADAHPIHIHLVQFRIVNRQGPGGIRGPEPGETGFKDTVIAYPGEVTRVQARFDIAGRYVWHCHIVEHEDNEMMRPYDIL